MAALQTKWFKPYTNHNGKLKPSLNLPNSKYQTGIYFIKSERTGEIIYVGYSGSNLHRTIYRHFQKWNDTRERKVYKKSGYLVRIIFTTPKQASRLEKYLIQKLQPRDNNTIYKDVFTNPEVERIQETYSNIVYARPNEEAPF